MPTKHERTARWQDDLLPHVVDRLARETPDAPYGIWVTGAGLRTITYAQLANAVNGLARWIVEHIGPGPGSDCSSEDPEVLTYIGPNDMRYSAMIFAAVKAGYVLFLTSPRNSAAAHRALFNDLDCRTLLTTDPLPPPALAILDAVRPRYITAPSVNELLTRQYPPFAFDKTFQTAQWEPMFVIHTSGSTGLPKPLVWTHETANQMLNVLSRPAPGGIPSIETLSHGKRVIATLPPFHGAGLSQFLFNAIPFGSVPIIPVTAAIPTAEVVAEVLRQTPAEVAVLAPSVVAELAQSPELLDFCAARLETVLYIGGDLPQAIGDRVAAKMHLRCQWGASEVGIPQQLLPPELKRSDWRYVRFHPCIGAAFPEVADGSHELVFRRDDALADTQTAFSIWGQDELEEEYRTKDLFKPHPTIPDMWRWCARADDIIVFLNGEKTNPVSMEQHIVASNPELGGAIVIGAQRLQAALLIESARAAAKRRPLTTAKQAALIERVWPSVEEANRSAPAHARVDKSFILVIPANRPLLRAGKGTLQRAASVAQYAAEIDRLYAQADEALDDETATATVPTPTGAAEVSRIVRKAVRAVTGWSVLSDTDGFFERGMDSLQGLRLTRTLRRALGRPDLALSTIYQHPTVRALVDAVLAQGQTNADDDRAEMEPLLETYSKLLLQIPRPEIKKTGEKDGVTDVILTGSTGTIGPFLLRALLARPRIGHVFCLNRRAIDATAHNLNDDNNTLSDRVTFLQADLAAPRLGLDATTYETLRARAGILIHNAWPVNFNLALPAFRPQFVALVNVFALAAAAAHPVRVLFVSSVSAMGRYKSSAGSESELAPAPEGITTDMDAAFPNGYARAKYVGERLCDAAATHLGRSGDDGVSVAIARLGQIAGAVHHPGLWNPAEWLPSLVLSSAAPALQCVPAKLGLAFDAVDFVPVDVLADALVDLAGTTEVAKAGVEVFNLRNPHATSWAALLPAVVETVKATAHAQLEVVDPATWLARLQESSVAAASEEEGEEGEGEDLAATARKNPAIKLLDFFQAMYGTDEAAPPPMVIERALAASPALRALGPVEQAWMRKWVGEWMAVRDATA